MINKKETTEKKIESLSLESKDKEELLTKEEMKKKQAENQMEKLSTNFF